MNNGNQMKRLAASGKGPADYFTGAVRIDPLFHATETCTCSRCSREHMVLATARTKDRRLRSREPFVVGSVYFNAG
jgi:hypothetical protein